MGNTVNDLAYKVLSNLVDGTDFTGVFDVSLQELGSDQSMELLMDSKTINAAANLDSENEWVTGTLAGKMLFVTATPAEGAKLTVTAYSSHDGGATWALISGADGAATKFADITTSGTTARTYCIPITVEAPTMKFNVAVTVANAAAVSLRGWGKAGF
jgi:hypothetical protein